MQVLGRVLWVSSMHGGGGGLKQAFCHLVIIKGKFIGCEDSQHNHHAVLPVHNTGKTVY